ncbi:MAG: nucleotide pyrophosphohydrolase [Mobilicoccus sp.]|nr:nucleotide pyrophosphohydrolase [Mobilicoccus sp.]
MTRDLPHLSARLRDFTAERGWERFHDPKSLILALVGEVGELAELFQWVDAADAREVFQDPGRQQRAAEEMSDVLIYLTHLANVLDIDLAAAAHDKLTAAAERYPATDGTATPPPQHD